MVGLQYVTRLTAPAYLIRRRGPTEDLAYVANPDLKDQWRQLWFGWLEHTREGRLGLSCR